MRQKVPVRGRGGAGQATSSASNSASNRNQQAKVKTPIIDRKSENTVRFDDADDENSGFSGWLKSDDGIGYMKMFVITNSIIMLTTVGWPHITKTWEILQELINVIGWYTSGVWKGMNQYYDDQFKKYLHTEMEKNPRMKEHLEGSRFFTAESSNVYTPPPLRETNNVNKPPLQEKQNFDSNFETEQGSKIEEQLAVLNEMTKNSAKDIEIMSNDDDQGVCSIVPSDGKIFREDNLPCG